MGLRIAEADAERIAKSYGDLIGPKGLDRIRRKAVNQIGSDIRKQTRAIGPDIFNTSAAALQVKGRAAAPGSSNPAYKLYMTSRIPVARMKAKARKITRRRGRASLSLLLPSGEKIAFRSVRRDGPIIRLLKAGALPERTVGGIYTDATFERHPAFVQLRRDAAKALPEAVARQINDHLAKRKR